MLPAARVALVHGVVPGPLLHELEPEPPLVVGAAVVLLLRILRELWRRTVLRRSRSPPASSVVGAKSDTIAGSPPRNECRLVKSPLHFVSLLPQRFDLVLKLGHTTVGRAPCVSCKTGPTALAIGDVV